MPWSCVVWRILVSIPSTDYHTNSTKSQYEIRYSGHNAMFLFSYYTLAGLAITRESGLTGTEIGSLSIGAISIDVTNGMRGGAFIDIWISKIIEWIDTDDPTWGNLDAKILEFFYWLVGFRNPWKLCLWIRNPGHWNPKYSSRNPESHKKKSGYRSLLSKGKRNE